MKMGMKNFYLNTPLKRYKYLCLKIEGILEDVKQQYKLSEEVKNNEWVYVAIRKGMYSLPQAGLLAQELLAAMLAEHGYTE